MSKTSTDNLLRLLDFALPLIQYVFILTILCLIHNFIVLLVLLIIRCGHIVTFAEQIVQLLEMGKRGRACLTFKDEGNVAH